MTERTRKNIESLLPEAQVWAKAFLGAIEEAKILPSGFRVEIISGTRSWKEQDELFAQGRSRPGDIITNARGGQSNHNFGIAWDIGIFDPKGNYLAKSLLYRDIGMVGHNIGLEWGGNWVSMVDEPHFQIKTGKTLSELRSMIQKGMKISIPEYHNFKPVEIEPNPKIKIFENNVELDFHGYLERGRVWVPIRKFINHFGGQIQDITNGNFALELHNSKISIPGVIKDGIGYVRFGDVNRVLDWDFEYRSGSLRILTEVK